MSSLPSSQAIAIIPSRLNAKRLPNKPLLEIAGLPLVICVAKQVKQCRLIDDVIVATDSREIASVCQQHGVGCWLDPKAQPTGSDRVAHWLTQQSQPPAIVLNVQGDEPFVSPNAIDHLVAFLRKNPQWPMATLAQPLQEKAAFYDKNVVKVVLGEQQEALYFSRAAIPHRRDDDLQAIPSFALGHLGVYAFQQEALRAFGQAEPCPLEQLEKLEQLRALWMGMRIKVLISESIARSINTLEDLRWAQSQSVKRDP